jgi:AraC-like DNA-binding protein
MAAESILTQELRPFVRYADLLQYKQWKTPPRIITDYLLLYLKEGSLQLSVEDESYALKPGQFGFIQPGLVHQIESLSPITTMALHIELFPTESHEHPAMIITVEHGHYPYVERMQPNLNSFGDIALPVVIKPSRSEWMVDALQQVIEHWSRKNALDLLQANVRAAEIILQLIKDHATLITSDQKSSTDLAWVPAYMQYRLSEPITVEEMARKAFMSRSYFSLLFRTQFGLAPHQYLLKLRLDSATDLLRGTSMPLQDIADSCGFSSLHHFSKMYKLGFGYPPSHVRHDR